MRTVLQGKYAADVKVYAFDFSAYFSPGSGLTSVMLDSVLYSGVAGAALVLGSGGNAANIASVTVSGGVAGNVYVLLVTASGSGPTQLVRLNAFLPILLDQS